MGVTVAHLARRVPHDFLLDTLGRLDPHNGKSDFVALGPGAAPHDVIVGPDVAAWVTEGGQNAIAWLIRRPAR